ncbi:hypothetical protein A2U01_0033609, partial [Trifolium medium]|nr:hypothetical protein [Trifolium medium]
TNVIGTFPQPMEDLPKKRKDFIDYVKSRLASWQVKVVLKFWSCVMIPTRIKKVGVNVMSYRRV